MKAENLLKLKEITEICNRIPKFLIVDGPVEKLDLSYFGDYKSKKFAVRSSCYLEDCTCESHAGQFKTFLNVTSNDILQRIQEVHDSYDGYGGKVIIQEMIESDISGVIFTANPVGILNEVVIVAGYGLGDNIVEDKVNTSTYYYNIDDKLYYTEEKDILTKEQVGELVDISLSIKKYLGYESDLEFAIKNSEIYILQARPITTLSEISEKIILDNSNIVESYPGISLPLTQDFVKEIYYKVFRSLVLRITTDTKLVNKMDSQLRNMVDVANGRIYYRISNWYDVLNLLPFSGKIIPMWQNMLGVENKNIVFNSKVKTTTKIKVLTQFVNLIITSPKKMEKLNKFFENKLYEYRTLIDNSFSISALLDTYEFILKDLTDVWDITLVNDMYSFIFTALSGKKGKEKLANIKNLESMKPVKELNKLVAIYKIHGEDDVFNANFNDYIEIYGDRCLEELKLETETYRTNPELLRQYVKTANVIDIKETNTTDRDNFFVKRAKVGIYNREVSRMNRSRIFGLAREIMLKIGDNLALLGLIENSNDVFYLRYSDLEQIVINGSSWRDKPFETIELVNKRKLQCSGYETIPCYSRLVFKDKIINKTVLNTQVQLGKYSRELLGVASSIGKVTGEVIIVDKPDINIDTNDKIIVTKTTDPGWVFLIKNAKGIIAEKGSMLSHTAIITRELKKPSIVNVKDITSILKTGDIVELDAYEGIVKLIEVKSCLVL